MNVQASHEGDGEEEEGEVQPGQLLSPHASHPTSRSAQGNKYHKTYSLAALVILPLTIEVCKGVPLGHSVLYCCDILYMYIFAHTQHTYSSLHGVQGQGLVEEVS